MLINQGFPRFWRALFLWFYTDFTPIAKQKPLPMEQGFFSDAGGKLYACGLLKTTFYICC
jgi:hypothetical protein